MKISSQFIPILFFIVATLYAYVMIPMTEGIEDYFAVKIIVLFVGVVCCVLLGRSIMWRYEDRLIYVFAAYVMGSVLVGDYDVASIKIHLGLMMSYVLIYVLIRYSGFKGFESMVIVYILIAFELIFKYLYLGEEKSVNGAYLVGSLSVFALGTTKKFSRTSAILIGIACAFYSGLRYLGAVCLYGLKKYKQVLVMGFCIIVVLYVMTYLLMGTSYYTYLLGYRVAEPVYVIKYLINDVIDFVIGKGAGSNFFMVEMGSKGYIVHSGRFHNFYLTLLYNYGLIGLGLFWGFIYSVYKSSKIESMTVMLAAFLVMIAIDGPRDGNWPVFALSAIIVNNKI